MILEGKAVLSTLKYIVLFTLMLATYQFLVQTPVAQLVIPQIRLGVHDYRVQSQVEQSKLWLDFLRVTRMA